MHIARADGMRVQRLAALPPWMGDLCNEQAAVRLRDLRDLRVSSNPPIVVVDQDGIAECFDRVVRDHRVPRDDDADLAFAPALVEKFVFFAGVAAGGDGFIFGVPVAETLGHGGFEEAVGRCAA